MGEIPGQGRKDGVSGLALVIPSFVLVLLIVRF